MIELVGAQFDLGGSKQGSRLGPDALRLAGLKDELERLGYDVFDQGNVSPLLDQPESEEGFAFLSQLLSVVKRLRTKTLESLRRGSMPIVLGGEHTIAVGGISAALEVFHGDLAVLWIDAHADLNTPGISPSGNLHGMPLAALQQLPSGCKGPCDVQWQELIHTLNCKPLSANNTAHFALRDVDASERPLLVGPKRTMYDVDRYGVERTLFDVLDALLRTGATNLWISFDVDALDPILAPGTGTAVRGGLTYREAHLLAELICERQRSPNEKLKLAGVDVVETNPLADEENATAVMAVEWLASLLGKTILGRS